MIHRFVAIILGIVALGFSSSPGQVTAQTGERCFPETNQCISGRFRQYWEQNGGLPVFGLPITTPANEPNRDTGQTYLSQWFERTRFELHPENAAPYDVLLGRLGAEGLVQLGVDWQALTRESGAKPDCLWFEQTGRNVCNIAGNLGFKAYWESHGLEFDGKRGTSYEESLALFGLPLTVMSSETTERSGTVLTQWFERARFEWHPDEPDEFKVLVGLLGSDQRGGTPAPSNAAPTSGSSAGRSPLSREGAR